MTRQSPVWQQVFNGTVCLPLSLFVFPGLDLKTDVRERDQQVGTQAGLRGRQVGTQAGLRGQSELPLGDLRQLQKVTF